MQIRCLTPNALYVQYYYDTHYTTDSTQLDCKQSTDTECSTTDTSCLCADEHYKQSLSACTKANCSTREALSRFTKLYYYPLPYSSRNN